MLLNDDELEMVSGGAEEGNIQTQYVEFSDGLGGRGGIGTFQWITH